MRAFPATRRPTAGPAPQVTVDQLKRELSPLVGAKPLPWSSDRRGTEARARLARGQGGRQRGVPRHPRQGDAGVRSTRSSAVRRATRSAPWRSVAEGPDDELQASVLAAKQRGISSILHPPDDAVRAWSAGRRFYAEHSRRTWTACAAPRVKSATSCSTAPAAPLRARPSSIADRLAGFHPSLDGRALRRDRARRPRHRSRRARPCPSATGAAVTDNARFQDLLRRRRRGRAAPRPARPTG